MGLSRVEKFCREEATAYAAYTMLAEQARDERLRGLLLELARQEERHKSFWAERLGRDCKPYGWKIRVLKLLYRVLGPVFVLQLLERGEEEAVAAYREYLVSATGEERRVVEEMIDEEERHEQELIGAVEDVRVKYMGYIALGLADAIVEITGVHAGFLGATSSTIMAGIAGLVVGFSAALSMAGAAYLQAKHEATTKPSTSAFVTGLSYIASVVMLALPYFLLESMFAAFTVSLIVALLLTAGFTFYSTVVQGKSFAREYIESTVLLMATAFGSFVFGEALGRIFGVRIA